MGVLGEVLLRNEPSRAAGPGVRPVVGVTDSAVFRNFGFRGGGAGAASGPIGGRDRFRGFRDFGSIAAEPGVCVLPNA